MEVNGDQQHFWVNYAFNSFPASVKKKKKVASVFADFHKNVMPPEYLVVWKSENNFFFFLKILFQLQVFFLSTLECKYVS